MSLSSNTLLSCEGELQAGGAKRGSVDATGIGLLVEGGGGQGAVPAAVEVDATLADPRALSKVVAEAPHGASPNSLPSSRLNVPFNPHTPVQSRWGGRSNKPDLTYAARDGPQAHRPQSVHRATRKIRRPWPDAA